MKQLLAFLLALVISVCTLAPRATAQQIDTITILHFNDTHSSLAPYGPRTAELLGTRGGIARLATVIGMTRTSDPNVLTLHAGDFSIGDIFYNTYYGVPELRMYAAFGLDAMTLGNHEFDLSPETLQHVFDTAFSEASAFPILSANCVFPDTGFATLRHFVRPFTTKMMGNTKVGIFGLTTPETDFISHPAPLFIDTNFVTIAAAMVDNLRAEGCQVVVLLSHLGYYYDSIVASIVPGINVIVGGHDHFLFETPRRVVNPVGDTVPILQVGAHLEYMGKMRLAISGNHTSVLDYTLLPLDASIPEEPATKANIDTLIQGIEETYGQFYSARLTYASDDFLEVADSLFSNGNHDTPVGNLVTDAFRASSGTDIAIEVGGSTADELYRGPIVGADLFRMIGYGDNTDNGLGYRLATFRIAGKDLLTGIEYGLTKIGTTDDFLVQASGMKYIYDPTAPDFQRVTSVTIDGAPLDTGKLYTVTSNEFTVLLMPALGIPMQDVRIHRDTAEYQIVAAYVSTIDTIHPLVEGRVQAICGSASVAMHDRDERAFSLFPNPIHTNAIVQFTGNEPESIQIEIFRADGTRVASFRTVLANGLISQPLPLDGHPDCSYYCSFESSHGQSTIPFVIQR